MTRDDAETVLANLEASGFDRARIATDMDPDGEENGDYRVSVRCSQCEALVINGIATHETRCPNAPRDADTFDDFDLTGED